MLVQDAGIRRRDCVEFNTVKRVPCSETVPEPSEGSCATVLACEIGVLFGRPSCLWLSSRVRLVQEAKVEVGNQPQAVP